MASNMGRPMMGVGVGVGVELREGGGSAGKWDLHCCAAYRMSYLVDYSP